MKFTILIRQTKSDSWTTPLRWSVQAENRRIAFRLDPVNMPRENSAVRWKATEGLNACSAKIYLKESAGCVRNVVIFVILASLDARR